MSEHEQYDEDLALYALDALRGDDRAKLDQHLTACGSCRLELERLRADTALLAMSAMGPRPPQRARQRLLDAVAREARAPLAHDVARRPWGGWVGRAGMGRYGGRHRIRSVAMARKHCAAGDPRLGQCPPG